MAWVLVVLMANLHLKEGGETPLTAPEYEATDCLIRGTVDMLYGLAEGEKGGIVRVLEDMDICRKRWKIGYGDELWEM